MENYDVLIVGGGPAGLSCALYSARALKKTLLIEKLVIGGLITTTLEIENYPGAPANSTGESLTERMRGQAEEAGCVFAYGEVNSIEEEDGFYIIKTRNGKEYRTRVLVAATGTEPRLLNIPGEREFRGRGVSYCATCDAGFFRGKKVAVVGGGDTAVKEASYLTRFASSVVIIHRRDELRASAAVRSLIASNEKISFLYSCNVKEILGEKKVHALRIAKAKTGEESIVDVDGVFIFAGYTPITSIFERLIQMDEAGYIITDEDMRTSANGVFACGDVRKKNLRQVITAASDGAIAATQAEIYIDEMTADQSAGVFYDG